MKFVLVITLLFSSFLNQSIAEDTFCTRMMQKDWPGLLHDTDRYITERLASSESDRATLDQEFEKLAQKSSGASSEEDQRDLRNWLKAVRDMTELRTHPDLVHATVRAAAKVLNLKGNKSIADKILNELNTHSAEKEFQMGLEMSEEIDSLLERSHDSALKEKIENWQKLYPETFGVFLTTNLLRLAATEPKLVHVGVVDRVKNAVTALSNWSSSFVSSKVGSKRPISDSRFKKMLELGPKAERRLRFITAVQVALAVGSVAVVMNDIDTTHLYTVSLQLFGPQLGSSMTKWAYAAAPEGSVSVDHKKLIQKRWSMWGAVILTQTLGVFLPNVEWFSNLVFGPGGAGILLGRGLTTRSLSVDKTSAADAITDSMIFGRLSVGQLNTLEGLVSESKRIIVQNRIKELASTH